MRLCYCLLLACLIVLVSACIAQSKTGLSPLPSGTFNFQGTWDCAGSFRGGKTHRAVFTGSVILGGAWLELAEKDVEPATGYVAKYLIGYDAQKKRLVEFDANNFGAATYASSEGWRDNVLTMTSIADIPGSSYGANRFIYTVTAPGTFSINWQIIKTGSQDWVSSDHLECKSSGS